MKKLIVIFSLFGIACAGMEQPRRNTIIQVPAIPNKPYRQTSHDELCGILYDEHLSAEGVLDGIVIRPEKDKRIVVSMCEITPPPHIFGVIRTSMKISCKILQWLP